MILLFTILGCSQKPFVFQKIQNQCRQTSSVVKTERDGILKERKLVYQWEENEAGARVDFQTLGADGQLRENYQIYNEQGFLIEDVREGPFDKIEELIEYDCTEEYCWKKKSRRESTSASVTSIVRTESTWEGRTESYNIELEITGSLQIGEMGGYKHHNDYGEPTKEYYKFDQGFQKIIYEYDCDEGWCKVLSKSEIQVLENESIFEKNIRSMADLKEAINSLFREDEILSDTIQSFDWTKNRQEWSDTYSSGYQDYNKHGYITEAFTEEVGVKLWTTNTYDCGHE